MNDNEEEYEPKISNTEALFVGIFLLVFDAAEITLDLLLAAFGLDHIVNLASAVLFSPFILYCYLRGIPLTAMVIADVVELVPYVGDFFPTKTIGWAVTVYQDRNPQSAISKAVAAGVAVAQSKGAARSGGDTFGAKMKQLTTEERRQALKEVGKATVDTYRNEVKQRVGLTSAQSPALSAGGTTKLSENRTSVSASQSHKPGDGKDKKTLDDVLGIPQNEMQRFEGQVFQTPTNDNGTPAEQQEAA